jgi:hypothetical protein
VDQIREFWQGNRSCLCHSWISYQRWIHYR